MTELTARRIEVRNPRTGRNDYVIEQCDGATLQARTDRLRAAQPGWRAAGVAQRAQALRALAAAMAARRDDLVAALTADTGRVAETVLEVDATLGAIERWCAQAPALLEEPAPEPTSIPFIEVGREAVPYALAGVISPWNFPLLLSLIDTVPALLAGCACLVKPSEVTPRFIAPLDDAIAAVPEVAAVLAYLAGDGGAGAAVVDSADLVCFTGSVKTGRLVGEAAARNFIPAHLELGGKDPAIVTRDTDVARAAAALGWGGMVNAGQSCLSIERVYVDAAVHDEFLAALAEDVGRLRINTPDIEAGEIGPIIFAGQIEIIQRHLDDALERGAQVECGGRIEIHDGGSWCLPTVLSAATHDMRIMREETFAPILPVMAYDSIDQAVQLANDTIYGLSAAVFCDDPVTADAIARRLDAGAISINDAALTSIMHEGEKQAFKLSGLGGSRMGTASIRRFMKTRAHIRNVGGVWDPWWYRQRGGDS